MQKIIHSLNLIIKRIMHTIIIYYMPYKYENFITRHPYKIICMEIQRQLYNEN